MRNLLHWWLQQLTAMLPIALLKMTAEPADAAIIDVAAERATLAVRQRGAVAGLGSFDNDDAGFQKMAQALGEQRGLPDRLVLRLPAAAVLLKRLSLPAGAQRHLQSLLGFEMDRETPFARDEAHWDFAVRRKDAERGRVDVDLAIVPRSVVDPLVETARRAGLEPAGIEVAGAGESMLIRLAPEERWGWLRSQRSLVVSAATVCVLALVAVAIPFIRQQQALSSAGEAIDSLTAQAQEAASLRKSVDQLAATIDYLQQERTHNGSALAALAAATRAIPDDTHLTALTLHEGRLTVTGLSPSSARLVGSLAQSADFREPGFDSPVLQNDGSGLETFTISFALKPAGAS